MVRKNGGWKLPLLACALLAGLVQPAYAAPSSGGVGALEASEYVKDFGVPWDRAVSVLETQARGVEANIAADLEARLGSRYAGIWFDNDSNEFVVPTLASASGDEIAEVFAAAGLEMHDFRMSPARSSWGELESAQRELDASLSPLIRGGLIQSWIDPRTNSIAVRRVEGLAKGASLEVQSARRRATVRVEERAFDDDRFNPVPAACGWGGALDPSCDPPLRGGVQLGDSGCTAGFKATGVLNSVRYILSAGHCAIDPYVENWVARDSGGTYHPLGVTEAAYWGTSGRDVLKVRVTDPYWDISPWPTQVIEWDASSFTITNSGRPITGEARSFIGQQACKTGITTGTSCGTVRAMDITVDDVLSGRHVIVNDLTELYKVCNAGGDSGGPVYSGNTALGITSFADDKFTQCEQYDLYTEITDDTDYVGVTVAPRQTQSFGTPIVETKTASSVAEFQATLNGTVNPSGSATTYRFEYGTTTSYGESVPVSGAAAGAGSSAVSVSATAERLEPGTTYHYRLIASNSGGTSYGSDQTFHTPGWRFMRGLSSGSGVSSWSTAIGMDLPPMAVGDVNGDGKDDVVSVEKDNGLYRYKFGYSDGSGIASWDQVLAGVERPTRLAVGDLTGDGKADIVAVEPQGNGQYRYMLGYGTGAGISSWSQVMSGMSYPHKLALGDLTGDGKADLVVVESQPDGKYRYMLGASNGAGIGSWSQILSNMAYAEFMDLGDFNADGKADVVSVENQGNGQFRFMLGTSNGAGIGSWSQVMTNMAGPYFFNAGDFNADGKADIVSVESDGAGKYRYMLGTGNGAGIGSWSQILGGMGLPTRSDLGDLTGDGKADIVSVETESTGSYNYRLGISSGSGVSAWNQLVSWMRTPRVTGVGDVNADGKADIVSVESEGGGKYRYKVGFSNAFGIASNWKTVLTGMGLPNTIKVGDLTGDGKADIVAVEPQGNGQYRYMLGKSSGTGVASWGSILSGMGLPTRMNLGDFSGDGKADIVAFEPDGSGKYRIMRGLSNGAGISSWSQILGGLGYPQKAAVGDLTGDGKADIVSVESQGNGKYRYMLGKSSGSGISSWTQVMSEMAYAEFMDLGDFNADGKADVVSVENQGNGQFRFMLGTSNGAGIGSWSQAMGNMAGPYFFHLGDLDGDGKADIVSVETM